MTFGKEFAIALAKMQKEIAHPLKKKLNPHFKSKYAALVDVIDTNQALLGNYGFSIIQSFDSVERDTYLITTLLHESGQYIQSKLPLLLEKPTPQAQGSAITYARRYALSAILGIASDEDDDANSSAPAPAKPLLNVPAKFYNASSEQKVVLSDLAKRLKKDISKEELNAMSLEAINASISMLKLEEFVKNYLTSQMK